MLFTVAILYHSEVQFIKYRLFYLLQRIQKYVSKEILLLNIYFHCFIIQVVAYVMSIQNFDLNN